MNRSRTTSLVNVLMLLTVFVILVIQGLRAPTITFCRATTYAQAIHDPDCLKSGAVETER